MIAHFGFWFTGWQAVFCPHRANDGPHAPDAQIVFGSNLARICHASPVTQNNDFLNGHMVPWVRIATIHR
jgi:hypothetical protein